MLVELKNIKKYFLVGKTVVKAVDDVCLSILKGENLGLVGESGCGKTTLSKIILKLLLQDSGQLFFSGENVTNPNKKQLRIFRQKIQMVFQDPYSSLDPRFTVRDILNESFEGKKVKGQGKNEKEIKIEQILEAVHLPQDVLDRYPHEFSGGERQRIAIARVLLVEPKLLILDEAVSSLDVIIQKQILDLLKSLQSRFDLTYLFISHNLRVVRKVCSKIAVMYKGRIVEYGFTQDIFNNPLHPYTKRLLKASIEYQADKAVESAQEKDVFLKSRLVDDGQGHWVLK